MVSCIGLLIFYSSVEKNASVCGKCSVYKGFVLLMLSVNTYTSQLLRAPVVYTDFHGFLGVCFEVGEISCLIYT